MHEKPNNDPQKRSDQITTATQDAGWQSQVLQRTLELAPQQLAEGELLLELVGEEPAFYQRDAIGRAIQDLAGYGLLHKLDIFIFPTRPAQKFYELLENR